MATNDSKTFLGAISVSARRQPLDEFEHQILIIEKELEHAGLITQRAHGSICRLVGQQPGCKPIDITVLVWANERSADPKVIMVNLGQRFDLDNVLLASGFRNKFELRGTSNRRHAYPTFDTKVCISNLLLV